MKGIKGLWTADELTRRDRRGGPIIQLNREAVYDGIRRGDIPATKIGRRYFIPASWVRSITGIENFGEDYAEAGGESADVK